MYRRLRMVGTTLALLGLPVACARIYLGVHFPFDMLGAAVVAVLSAWLAMCSTRWYLPPAYRLATWVHRTLFGKLVALGVGPVDRR